VLPSHRSRARARRGAASVELAVLAPFLCFAFVVTVDYGRIFYFSLTVNNCARNGALYGSQDADHALDTSNISRVAVLDGGNLDASSLSVSSTTDSTTAPTWVEVTVTYPFTTFTKYPGVPATTNLSRTVRTEVVPATPTFP
jgi:Flp pilus assembly protein TadG